ncbi:hypothetical protein [Bdellovibrio sp. HCB-162]|uniref:hypothetical protein n=1 Tax=Bdellovibrio sp. HCB-162 TaxID=3394234 RepID=UPI0039BD7405
MNSKKDMTKPLLKNVLAISHRLFLSSLLTSLTVLAPASVYAKGPACGPLFSAEGSAKSPAIDGSWRKVSADLFMGFRSNAPHYWNWLRSQKSPLLEARGVVSGDPHILNFGDIPLKNGKREYALIDVDDSGVNAPLAGDFLRYFVGNQISGFKVHPKDLYNAYLDGLSGQTMAKPDYLTSVESKSADKFSQRQEKYLDKISQNKKFSGNAPVSSLTTAPKEIQDLYKRSLETFKNLIQDHSILDVGYRIKDSGGSMGLPRFWFLLEKKGQRHVWEFKLETDPASSLFAVQPDALDRFTEVSKVYRPSEKAAGPYGFIQSGNDVFLVRERFDVYFDLDPAKAVSKKDIQDGQEMSLYLANQMGLRHGAQQDGTKLLKSLEKSGSYDSFLNLAKDYANLISQENQ